MRDGHEGTECRAPRKKRSKRSSRILLAGAYDEAFFLARAPGSFHPRCVFGTLSDCSGPRGKPGKLDSEAALEAESCANPPKSNLKHYTHTLFGCLPAPGSNIELHVWEARFWLCYVP